MPMAILLGSRAGRHELSGRLAVHQAFTDPNTRTPGITLAFSPTNGRSILPGTVQNIHDNLIILDSYDVPLIAAGRVSEMCHSQAHT